MFLGLEERLLLLTMEFNIHWNTFLSELFVLSYIPCMPKLLRVFYQQSVLQCVWQEHKEIIGQYPWWTQIQICSTKYSQTKIYGTLKG